MTTEPRTFHAVLTLQGDMYGRPGATTWHGPVDVDPGTSRCEVLARLRRDVAAESGMTGAVVLFWSLDPWSVDSEG